MIQKLNQRRVALAAVTEQHLDALYDLIFQVYGDRETSLHVLQKVLRSARHRYRFKRLERYSQLWILRITVERIQAKYRHFLSEQNYGYTATLHPLSLEEKLCVLLQDRLGLSLEQMSVVMQLHEGRVGRSLVYGREKLAKALGLSWDSEFLPLPARVRSHFSEEQNSDYLRAIQAARSYIHALTPHSLGEIDQSTRATVILPLLQQPQAWSWKKSSWKTKLALESMAFAAVGALAVIAMPWALGHINTNALLDGRLMDIVTVTHQPSTERDEEVISAERLIASRDTNEAPAETKVKDEFSDLDFPSGDSYEAGSAPLAPSRQDAAVYRLIIQSPSPREMIPVVRDLFASRKVHERDSSGRTMPGGVYFDAITTLGEYPALLKAVQELKQVGKPQTYGNANWQNRNPNEHARVIIWIQQI